MQTITIPQITQRLKQLSGDKLVEVYDFVSFLVEKKSESSGIVHDSETSQLMMASEAVLRKEWELPEEDRAWANL
jgi:hypothetical protein